MSDNRTGMRRLVGLLVLTTWSAALPAQTEAPAPEPLPLALVGIALLSFGLSVRMQAALRRLLKRSFACARGTARSLMGPGGPLLPRVLPRATSMLLAVGLLVVGILSVSLVVQSPLAERFDALATPAVIGNAEPPGESTLGLSPQGGSARSG